MFKKPGVRDGLFLLWGMVPAAEGAELTLGTRCRHGTGFARYFVGGGLSQWMLGEDSERLSIRIPGSVERQATCVHTAR